MVEQVASVGESGGAEVSLLKELTEGDSLSSCSTGLGYWRVFPLPFRGQLDCHHSGGRTELGSSRVKDGA